MWKQVHWQSGRNVRSYLLTSLVAQRVKRLSTMRETRVRSLGWEDPLEKEMAIHSSTIAWKIPRTEEPGRLQSMGSQRVRHDWATSRSHSSFNFLPFRRIVKGQLADALLLYLTLASLTLLMSLIPLSLTLWGSRFCGSKYSGLGTVHVKFKSHLCHLTSCVTWVKFIHFLGPQHFCLQSRENYSYLAEVWGLNGMRCVVRLLSYVQLLQPHGWQHARLPCPSLPPRDCSDSYQLSRWCHPTVSSSVTPFSFCPQSFPASGSFPVSQLFTSVWPKYWSFSFSISPSNEYSGSISLMRDWLDLLDPRSFQFSSLLSNRREE